MRIKCHITSHFFLFVIFFTALVSAQEDQWQGVERIVAIGDIHGDYKHYIEVLRNAGLVNRRGNWNAGETHFVQTGDLPDRGADTDRIIRHMQKLETQAIRQGGMVHALIGNHEAMNIVGDLRYVHPGEYEALKSRRARQLQNDYYERFVDYLLTLESEEPLIIDDAHRQQWNLEYPLGYVEHRISWSPEGEFGKWVIGHNSVIKINNILFLHGGISPQILGMDIRQINDQIRAELRGQSEAEIRILDSEDGPLWYRGLASNDEEVEYPHLELVLLSFGVDHIVIGHTPGLGTIVPRFGGKVLVIDTGISDYYGAHLASLLIENNQFVNIQQQESLIIPMEEADQIPYYQQVLSLEPETAPLERLIFRLQNPEPEAEPVTEYVPQFP